MLSEGSSVKGSPEDKQPSGPCIKLSAKISQQVSLALYTGGGVSAQGVCLPRGCVCLGGVHLHPPVDKMTDTSENITFPQLLLLTVM